MQLSDLPFIRLTTEVIHCCRVYISPPCPGGYLLPTSTLPAQASASAIPAQTLNAQPRLPAEAFLQSRTPSVHLAPSLLHYDVDFPQAVIVHHPKAKETEKAAVKKKAKAKAKIPLRRLVPPNQVKLVTFVARND